MITRAMNSLDIIEAVPLIEEIFGTDIPLGRRQCWSTQLLVIVKFPDPVHPDVTPVNVHVPVTVLFVRVPVRVSTLPLGVADCTVNSKPPVFTPLVLPVSVKPPVSDEVEAKHGVAVLNMRSVPVTVVLLLCCSEVVKEKAGVPSGFVRVALQFPLMLFDPPLPHAPEINDTEQSRAIANCLINNSFGRKNPFL
jgi:hypothetical protein